MRISDVIGLPEPLVGVGLLVVVEQSARLKKRLKDGCSLYEVARCTSGRAKARLQVSGARLAAEGQRCAEVEYSTVGT